MMKVIDISAWQENINWNLVKTQVDGVILKLGEYEKIDEMFIEHVNNAVAVGLPYGVYYYSHAENTADTQQEAKWVDNTIKTYLNGKTPALGIWFDAEDHDMLSGDVTAICSKFVNYLNGAGYTYVGIYASWNWLSSEGLHVIHLDELADYVPIWVAQYNSYNDLADEYPNKNIKVWQYTDHANIIGIPSGVDCNYYYD